MNVLKTSMKILDGATAAFHRSPLTRAFGPKARSFDIGQRSHRIFAAGLKSNFLGPPQTTLGDLAMYLHPQGLSSKKQSSLANLGREVSPQ